MAGDWIKIEHATLDKPEINIASEILGITQGDAFLLFVRYWVWIDQNLDDSCAGFVRFVSRKSVDRQFGCNGFAAILEKIGWASFDDEHQLLAVHNWERHHGKSAKSRALNQRRMSKSRAVSVRFENAPEKRREEILKPLTPPPKNRLQEPNQDHATLAKELGVPCETEFLKYRDWLSANGKRHANEAAGFRNWLRKAASLKREGQVASFRTAAHMPAKLPPAGPKTSMPAGVGAILSEFKAKGAA
jgi:hypothetical protein